jgi:hypothetical protein
VNRSASYGQSVSDDSETIGAVTPFSLAPPAKTRSALVTISGGSARYRFHGDPTTTLGHLIADGGNLEVFRDDITRIKFISTAGSVSLFVTYFREA